MELTAEHLKKYLTACAREPLEGKRAVVGHTAPDGDAVISALAEAWYRQVTGCPAVPVVQASALPCEVALLLGDIGPLLPLGSTPAVSRWLDDPATPIVLTDHHEEPRYRGRVEAVVDHHSPVPGADFTGVEVCMKAVGAATTLVADKWHRQGLIPDSRVAGILLGGILLDTDGLSPHKAHPEDKAAAAWLAALWGGDPADLYARLRNSLLSEKDVDTLYDRDYRQFIDQNGHPIIGFAILKVRRDAYPDENRVRQRLARDAQDPGYDICVAKIAVYGDTGLEDETYLAAGKGREAVLELAAAMAGPLAVRTAPDRLYLPADCTHRGRKRLVREMLDKWGKYL